MLCGNTGPVQGFDTDDANVLNGPPCSTGSNLAGYTVVDCNVWIGSFASGRHIKCAVYTDAQVKLCESAGVTLTGGAGNKTIPLSGCGTLTPNSRYWVAFNTDDLTLTYGSLLASACGGSAGDSRYAGATCGSTCQNPQPSPWNATAGRCPFRMYLTLRPLP